MKARLWVRLLAALACATSVNAWAQRDDFSFGVIVQGAAHEELLLREAIIDTDADNLAFVVFNGFKRPDEPCNDTLYEQRKSLLDGAKNGVILSLAASDWVACNGAQNNTSALAKLSQVRELFFAGDLSLGASKLPLVRQSATMKFRSYAENARWTVGDVMFATVNLPAGNNHYVTQAGRNSEFEDRQVATREWLKRIFTFAAQRKLTGIVLFADGNPLGPAPARSLFGSNARLDGYRDVRRQIRTLSENYRGAVLLVHGEPSAESGKPAAPAIAWEKNLGTLAAFRTNGDWVKINVEPAATRVFKVASEVAPEKEKRAAK